MFEENENLQEVMKREWTCDIRIGCQPFKVQCITLISETPVINRQNGGVGLRVKNCTVQTNGQWDWGNVVLTIQ